MKIDREIGAQIERECLKRNAGGRPAHLDHGRALEAAMSLHKSYRNQRAFERDVAKMRLPLDAETEKEIRGWKIRRAIRNICTMIFWICIALAAVGIGTVMMITIAKIGGVL